MQPNHVEYSIKLEDGAVGTRLTMDDRVDRMQGGCSGTHIATGHLASYEYLSYGDYTWSARIHHSPNGGPPPSNSFNCFSTFVSGGGRAHNELAWCFPATDEKVGHPDKSGTEVHMSYWVDATMHRAIHTHDEDLSKAVHSYTCRWRADGIDWLIDGVVVHQTRGSGATTHEIPWEPMSVRIIL